MQTPEKTAGEDARDPRLYRLIRRIVWRLSPKYSLYGTDRLPDGPCVIVANHCQIYGPIAAEFYMPRAHYTWCVGEMMNRKEVPAYAFQDFWSGKPRCLHWFYHLLSHIIAPLAEYVFTHAHTIAVYHDARVLSTFRRSMECMENGADIVIFPESGEPYNGLVWKFHEFFAELARLYYRKTGTAVCFVPMYITPKLKSIHFGEPFRFEPEVPAEEERTRICTVMMDAITELARSLPQHAVVPYPNIPQSRYPLNTDCAGGENKTTA